jgi:hypothetical protein
VFLIVALHCVFADGVPPSQLQQQFLERFARLEH